MATAVDICNIALSMLGDEATLSSLDPPEGSAQADHCARFYGVALSELLARKPWSFATKRTGLAPLSAKPYGEETLIQYAMPADCAYVIDVYSDAVLRTKIMQYSIETTGSQKVLLTTAPSVYMKYVSTRVNEEAFPPTFVSAMVHRVASFLAGAMIPGSTGIKMAGDHIKLYEDYINKAWALEARQHSVKERYVPRFLGDATPEMDDVYS